ncbi:autotransporter-associated beta strand repeat-containing protein [Yokenella regensburgei]|uniref:autotransporter-associated beta strand repeat-containing protein n=1 Tax=Yokenella regensburgei TaxID=158877 RepID=UPI00289A4EB2|nr:autotransporter-associated beta strand repeat-containing protein [Yokenella regensburgei]
MGILGGMALLSAANASTLIWSPTGQSSGGSGTWDTSSSAWYNGTITMPWNNAAGDSAWFGAPGGTVTLAGLIRVQDLSFTTDGYILSGGTLDTFSSQSLVNVSSGATATIDSLISGSGMLALTGGGKLILSGANTYAGGTSVSGGSVLEVSSDNNLGAAAGVLTLGNPSTMGTLNITGAFNGTRNVTLSLGGGNINVSPGVTATFNGVVSGNGALNLTGTGTTVLNGANTWTGTTTIGSGGTLQVGTGNTTGTLGTGATVNNGVLAFNRSNAYTYSGVISGTGSLQNIGSGTTTLSGNNTFTGGVLVSAGKLVLTNANNSVSGSTIASGATLELNGGASSISGNISNNGALNFSRGTAYTFAGVISGTGTVNQNAGNWITLTGANTYSGGTFIGGNGGIIVNNDNNLGAASGGITFNNGTGYFQAPSAFATSRTVTINSGATGFFSSSSGNVTLASPVVGAGSFGVNGGTVILTGTNNTYSGTTNINGGTLQINDESNLSSNAAGGITYTGGGFLRVMSSSALTRNIVMNASANLDAYNGSVVTLNGTVSGGGRLYFYGGGTPGGTVLLTGNNTHTGGIGFWTGSRVVVASDNNMGAATGLLQFNGGTLATTATFAAGRAVDLNGAGAFDVASGTTLTMNGVVSGAGRLTKANTGTLVLSGANTWTGGTTISGGTLQIGNGGTSGSFGTGNVTNNGTLAFNRSDVTSYNNVISGTGAVVQSGSGSTTLSGNNTYTGATTVSAGTLYVNGNQSSATGLTTVSSGATLGGSGTIGGSVTVADGGTLTPGASANTTGTLTIRGNLALSSGAVLNYNLGQAGTVGGALNDLTVVNGNLTLAGTLNVATTTGGTFDAGVYRIISYAGSLTNNGMVLGSLPAGANATLQTSVAGQVNLINNYAGTTFWDGAAGHDNSIIDGGDGIWNTGVGANSNWTDGAGAANGAYSTNFAVFQGSPGTVTVDNSQGQVAVTGMQFMADGYRIIGDTIALNETTSGSGFSTLRVGDGTAAGSGYTATIDAILDGFTGLSKTDLGTLILTGANTYTGGTNISGGTLQLGDGTTNGSVLGNIANAGTLALKPASGTSMAVSGVVSGSGMLRMIGTGTAVLTGANTYTGGTTISSGTLQIGDGTTNGTLPGNVVNNAALVFMPKTATSLNYGGVISGTGTVTQNGPGTTVFTGANTYTGGTIVSSGVLQLGDGTVNNDGSIAGNVANNGTLAFRFNGSKTFAGQISGSGNVSQQSGTTTLSGVNTYTGGTALNGGVLVVSNDNNLGDVSGRLTFNGGFLQTNATIARDIVINAGGGRIFSNGATFSGNISGTGVLEFQGGTTYITGNNTSSGGIILSEYGTVVINSASAVGTGKITGRSQDAVYGGGGNLRTTATMTLANDVDFGFTSFYGNGGQQSVGFITDAGTTLTMTGNFNSVGGYRPANGISKSGAGTMVLANASFQDGGYPVRVYAGTLIVGDGGTRGTIGAAPVQIASGAALKFNRGDTYLYSGGISGAGSFEQIGSGTLVLTGNNTQTGGSTITSGTVQLGNGGTSGWISGDITNNGTLAFNRSDNVTWSNLISGTGSLSKLGTNTLTLTGTQAYTGGTTINAGILQLGDGTTDGSIIGNVNMAGGALAFNASNGSITDQNALISGAGGVTKLGLGTTVLKGSNTYTGATTVSAGTLYIDGNQSAATGATSVANGATLSGTGTIGGDVTIANGATLMPGSESGTGGTLTINGNLALNDLSILNYQFGKVNGVAENTRTDVNGNLTLDGRLNVSTPAGGSFSAGVYRVFNYNGTLTNNGLVLGTVPAGTTLALQSTVPGQVNLINSTGQLLAFWDGMNSANYNQGSGEGGTGTWRLLGQTSWADVSGSSNSAYGNRSFAVFGGTAGTVTVDNSFGQIETSGMQFTTTGYVINGGVIALVNSPVDGSTPELRVGDGSDASRNITATIASVLQGATSVTKTDLGTLVLTGNNTWTGGTRVNGGVLQVSSDANLGATSGALSFDGGTLATTTSFNTARTTTLNTGGGTLDTAAGTTLTMSGIIGGTGALSKINSGTLLLTGTNTWTGGSAINGGIVQVSADANLGAATGPLSFDGGTLATTTSFNTGRATTLNTGGGTLDTAAGTTLTMSGVVSGSGALTKTNTGTLTLTNSNTWSGGTTISGGTLQLGNGGTSGSIAGNVTNDGTLAFNRSDTSTLAGVISGSGVVNQIGTGKTILSGINTYSGGTTISAGTLVAQNGAALGTGAVANNAALQLDFAADGTLANVLSGSGALSKTGSGTATLTGAGSAQGAVTVSSGTLAFSQSGAFNAASMNVASGAAITVSPISNIVLSGAYTQAAGATFNGVADTQAKTAVTAATASLNGTLNITGFGIAAPVTASGLTGTQYTVVHTTSGITGNFSNVNLNGAASSVDYLRLAGRVSGNDYNVGYGLSWLEGLAYGTGSFTLAGASDAFNVDVALGNQAAGTYTSGWDGKTLAKAGAGTLTLSSVNTYTGDTLVNGGTLKAGIANAFAQSANVAVASGAALDLNNFDQTARNLSGAGNVTLGSATLTENAVSDTTFSGTLSGTGGLTKTGSGVFTLSGSNTYSGGTTISAGTLVAQNGAALGTGAVANNAALQLDFAANGTLANALSGSGSLTKTGSGTATLTGAGSTQGAVTVSGGTLAFGQSGAFNAASLTTATGAGTQVAATSNLVLSGALTQAAGSTLTVAKGSQPAVTAQTASLNGTLSLSGYGTAAPASASGIAGTQYTVIHTTNGISGDFSSVNLNGAASTVDYLRLAGRVSGNDYNVGYGLSWLEGQAYGTGSFTLANASDAFNVDVALGDQAAGTYASGWDGKTLAKAGAGTLTLSSVNTYTGDTRVNGGTLKAGIANAFAQSANVAVASGAALDLNNFDQTARNLSGAGNVALGSATLTENAVSDTTFSGTLSGTGGLSKTGNGTFTLSGNNSYNGGTTIAAGTLQLGDGGTSGAITGNVTNNGTLTFNRSDATTFSGVISGSGSVKQVGAGKTLFTTNHTYSGGTTVSAGTLQLGNGGTTGSVQGAIDVASGATLAVDWGADYTLNNTLTGSGLVVVKAAGNNVNFASAAIGSGFSGTVDLQNALFSLGGVNTGALRAATLRSGSGSVTTVADGTQSIGGLAFDGGKVIFNATVPAQVDATSLVQANTLDASGTGTVQVTLPAPYVLPTPLPSTDLSLLEQDDVNVLTRLVSGNTVSGSGGALNLQDQNGNTISAAQQINVQQGGNLVALGTYDYRLSTGTSQDGLYVSYGLKQLDLQAGQTLTLAERAGATGAAADMSAKLTGSGSLRVDAGTGILSLSNTLNDFTGDTTVAAGTLQTDARNVIATSANVTVNAGAVLDTHGYHQSLTNLTGAGTVTNSTATATTLTLNDTTTSLFSGTISGAQLALVQATGTQILTGSNSYGGGTAINTGANLQLGNGGTSGSITGNVTNNGALTFNRSDAVTFTGLISGSGAINQTGTGTTVLTGANSYSGGTTISAGTLQLGNGGTSGSITGNVANNGVLAFNHSDTATFTGVISGTGAVNQIGSGRTILTASNSYIGGTTIASGTLQLGDGGTSGAITGNVTNNGTLTFNRSDAATFDGVISGSGNVTQVGAGKTLFTTNHTYSGGTTVSAGTLQLGNGGTTGSVQGAIDVASGATLAVDWGADYTLNNTLTGSGLVVVKAAGNNVNFASAAIGSGFSGTVDLQNALFSLGGVNTGALRAATLRSGSGSVTTVADGTQSIGGLVFDGGKVIFNATVPAQVDATSLVQANTLDTSGTGTVQITLPASYNVPTQAPSTELSLLEQDDANLGTRLVSASTTSGNAGALTLQDQNGNAISAAQQINVQQGGNLVALGTYDYRLSTGTSQDGLYVSYGLKRLDLQAGQTLTLAQNSGATGAAADMSAKLTGSGNLRVDAGTGLLSLSNTTNDFTGDTTVAAGTLQADARNVIAMSGNVAVNAGATLDTHGYDQSLTNLTGEGAVTNGTATATTLTLNDTATSLFSGVITGAQLALVQASGTQVLSGTNNWNGGTTINTGATLQLGNGGTTGSITGNVTNNGALAFNRSDTSTFTGVISGSGAVNQTGTGRTILSSPNSYTGGTTVSAGTLQLNNSQSAGTGAISINTALDNAIAGLELVFSEASDFGNQLTGTGAITVSGSQATIKGVNSGYTGKWRVTDTGTLAVVSDAVSSTDNLGVGGVDIATGGVVNAHTLGAFSFNNALTGSGTLNASGQGQAFSFGSGVGSVFTGMAVLTDNTFALSGDNTTALTHGKLSVGSGNVTTVGDGNQQIGGLIINDGTVVFNATAPDEILATSLITADTLDISHTGTVHINAPESYVPHARDTDNSLNLLMQDEGNTGVQLVKSTSVTGSGGAIQLLNKDGSKITAERTIDINQNGDVVARGTYDYRLTSGANADGLYVNYGLTELDLQADKTLTLAQDTGAINASADMSAKVTGSGNLAIEAGAGVVSLSNATNNYTGETKVSTGTLRSDADNALGKTSLLSLANTAGFDLNGKTQTVGKLNGDAGSLLNVNGGTLALSNGGVSAGTLTGAGKLSVLGGIFDVRGANTGLSVVSQISKGATASLNNVAGLGSGNIITDGTLALNGAVGTMTNNISGTGELVKQGTGEVVLTGQTGWTGDTHIDGGELVLDGSRGGAQLVSNVIAKDNTALSLRNGATLTGWIDPTDVSIDSASRWNMTADSLVDDVKLAGTINFASPSTQSMTAGRTLTATNWQGQDGTVMMNTALGGDTSVTDKIVISGNTSGNTFVKVNNVGGRGAQTIEGIQVVKVGGQSDGTFTKSGRIVAGIYDYSLVKKGADWYLTSLDTSTKDKKGTSGIRPESASYTANLAAANTMFVHRLHDREGETQYTDALTGERKVTSMWLRQVGGHNRWSSSVGQVDTQSNRYVTQLGGEVAQWSPDGVQRLHIGVMAGYGRDSSNSRSNATGYRSDGSVNGYSTGLYATWYQNDETKQGMYVDSWAQYGWFDNTVKGEKVQSESYKSKGITASLELGYTHKLGDFTGSQGTEGEWFIQPQAQAVWMGVTADDHYESNGTRVTGEGDGNVQTRLGVRTFLKSHSKQDEGKNRNFKPYVEINWIHNTQSFGSHMGDATLSQDGARNVGEVKAGVEGQLNSRLSVWGNVGVQVGDKGYSDTSATLGVKYNF